MIEQKVKKMKFINRETEFPGKKKLIKVDVNNVPIVGEPEIFVNVIKEEGQIYVNGTPISAENLNKGNWRDDDSLSFKKRTDNDLPAAENTITQIVTKSNGEIWIVPPAGLGKNAAEIAGCVITQNTGQSATLVMSQKAVTDILGDIASILDEINGVSV